MEISVCMCMCVCVCVCCHMIEAQAKSTLGSGSHNILMEIVIAVPIKST